MNYQRRLKSDTAGQISRANEEITKRAENIAELWSELASEFPNATQAEIDYTGAW